MEPNYTIYCWYILAILASAYAGIYVKKYIKENDINNIYIAVFLNSFLIYCYVKVFSESSMSSAYPFIKILSIVIVAITGIMVYSETLNISMIFGIKFGIISIYLLSQNL
jgi:multidrug transporter EmrE-like cation transporter